MALTEAEIADIVRRFALCARAVKDAGFTGVQIHAAHGYLLSQFFSAKINQRTDRYGGSLENRYRILFEIIDGIRYLWLRTPSYDPGQRLGRVANILAFTLRLHLPGLPVQRADLVVCTSHHPFPIYAARRMARRFDARLVFEVRDLWPLTLIELGGASRTHPFIRMMQLAEDFA